MVAHVETEPWDEGFDEDQPLAEAQGTVCTRPRDSNDHQDASSQLLGSLVNSLF